MGASRSTFRARLIAGALAPLVVAGALQALYSVISQRQAAIDGLEAKANAVMVLLVDVAGPSIAVDDPKSVDEALAYFAGDPDFEFALAMGADGHPISYRGPAGQRDARLAAATVTAHPSVVRVDQTLVASYPVTTGNKLLAEIVVGLSTSNVEAKVATLTTRAALISLVGILAAVLVVVVLAGRIARRNKEMSALLDTVDQGFLSVHADGTLDAERSAVATGLVGPHRPGQTLWQALAPIDPSMAEWLELGWASVREDFMPLDVSFDQLPVQMTAGDRVYRIEYKPVIVNEVLGKTLVVITDHTAAIARARAEAADRDLLQVVERITQDRVGFIEFVEETDRLNSRVLLAIGEPMSAELKRDLHTLKGNAGLYGLSVLAARCHALEDQLVQEPEVGRMGATAIAAAWMELKQKVESLFGSSLLRAGVDVRAEDLAELQEAIARGASLASIKQIVKGWTLDRVRPRLDRFADQARGLAARLGKQVVVEVKDRGVRLDAAEAKGFWGSFTHVVRNAIDHGIESPEDRVAAGKPEAGRIELETRREGAAVVIEVRDDGRGIDWEAVRARAVAANMPATTHDDLVAALLCDGVTTRDEVSETSGRGVGLAALHAACAQHGGSIVVTSERGKGSRFRFTFARWGVLRSTREIPRLDLRS